MKQFVRTSFGLAVASTVVIACSRGEAPRELDPISVGQVTQAISNAPMTWPTNWTPLKNDSVVVTDPTGDAQGSRDIVGGAAAPAAYVSADANRLFFRMRLGATPLKTPTTLNPFGWACELDVDANHQTYEFIANVNGIVQGDAVLFSQNTTQGTIDSPSDKAELELQTYSALVDNAQNSTVAHARVLAAGTTLGGGTDSFIDWAVDLNDFPASFNPLTTPFRLICGSSSNAQNISSDPVSASGATTLTDLVSDIIACNASGCFDGCIADADCTSAQFCNTQTHACTSKLSNGTAIPTVTGHTPALNGTCTASVGVAVCTSAVCDTTDNLCGFANGNGTCTAGNAGTVCRSGACNNGVCAAPGACTTDASCAASQFCNTATSTCVAKLTNGTAVPTIANHTPILDGTCSPAVGTSVCVSSVCDVTDDRCGLPSGVGPCTAGNAATVCRAGACSPNASLCMPPGGCIVDADCGATQYCDNSVFACTPKLANGTNIPTIAGHTPALNGTCTVAAGSAVCAAGVCDTADNRCGFADGNGTCTQGNAATVCRSGRCSNTGVCIAAGACAVDADCAASQFCDTVATTCVAKLGNGTSIPIIAGHAPALNGTCTGPVGTSVCVAAVCDTADDKCGFANGNGTCTAGTAATVCRGGACSPNALKCMPTGGCIVDADCSANQYCNNTSFSCTPKLPNGANIPTVAGHTPTLNGTCTVAAGAAVCAAGVCDSADNKCGYANGDGTCSVGNAATVCRSGACSPNASKCMPPGGCIVDADCTNGTCTLATFTCQSTNDGGLDASADADVDAEVDAGEDAAADAGEDAAVDAAVDAGEDASDAGTDAATTDASTDAAKSDATTATDASKTDSSTTIDPGTGTNPIDDGILEGGGISCAAEPRQASGSHATWLFGLVGVAALLRRRKK